MHRNFSFGLFVLVILSLLVWVYFEGPKEHVESSISTLEITDEKSKRSSGELSHNRIESQQEDTAQSNEAQFAEHTWFHQDPFLDYVLVRRYLYPCRNVSYKGYLHRKPATPQLTKVKEQFKQSCELWSKRYPEFSDESFSINTIEASTVLGQMLKNLPKKDPSDPKTRLSHVQESLSMLDWGIAQGNLIAIELSVNGLRNTWNLSFSRPEKELLGGEPHYLSRLTSIAIHLLKCESGNGFGCQPNDLTMLVACLQDESVCGMTYAEWVDLILTPGMKMDVEALMAYYGQNMD